MSRTIHKHAFRGKKSPTYRSWRAMKTRCLNTKHEYHWLYKGKLCQRWLIFENFLADMGERPEGLTIDRIDGSKGYYKANCRWADRKTQTLNSSQIIWVEFEGERHSLSEWARKTGIKFATLWVRYKKGYPPHLLFSKGKFHGSPL